MYSLTEIIRRNREAARIAPEVVGNNPGIGVTRPYALELQLAEENGKAPTIGYSTSAQSRDHAAALARRAYPGCFVLTIQEVLT